MLACLLAWLLAGALHVWLWVDYAFVWSVVVGVACLFACFCLLVFRLLVFSLVLATFNLPNTLSGESRCVCVQLRVPCRVLIQEVGAACVHMGGCIFMVTVELEFHAARFCVSRLLVAIPVGFERTLQADWRECFLESAGIERGVIPNSRRRAREIGAKGVASSATCNDDANQEEAAR